MTPFFGREYELKRLKELFSKKTASLVVIKGRCRVGKSRLISQFGNLFKPSKKFFFSGLPPVKNPTAADELEDFSQQLSREGKIPPPRADDWGNLFWALSEITKEGRVLVVLDEINWLGQSDPTFLGKLKNAWDLYFSQNPNLTLILSGSLSSWIDKNIISSTGFVGRISLNLHIDELPLKSCNEFWGEKKDLFSPFEKFKILNVTGGIPRYLEEIHLTQTAEENISRLCFHKEGFLFLEFEQMFSDLFKKNSARYLKILETLTTGPKNLDAIYKILCTEKTGKVSEYIEELEKGGFISRDYTWNLKHGRELALSLIRLKDNYTRFYLKYILPHKKKIMDDKLYKIPSFKNIMGLQFENLVASNREKIHKLLEIDNRNIRNEGPFFQTKTKRQKGCQIDYLIQTEDNNMYICEVKFSQNILDTSVIQEVSEKISRISAPVRYAFHPVLIHVNGVSEQVVNKNYFSSIINFGDFLL